MELSSLLNSNQIFLQLKSAEKEQFLENFISMLSTQEKTLNQSIIKDLIIKRENLCSTALDNHVAIPHAKIPGIDKTYISLATCPEGIEFGSIDGKKTKILILILHPEEIGNRHLEILKSVSVLFTKENVINEILNFDNSQNLIEYIKHNEQ
tara:strand:+ start:11310 stop:11765 length:456 start_codon:yes stop_codon:yes gene_type:complete